MAKNVELCVQSIKEIKWEYVFHSILPSHVKGSFCMFGYFSFSDLANNFVVTG